MTVFWPRIGKIQIDLINALFIKNLRKCICVHTDKMDIRQGRLLHFLDRAEKNAGVAFDTDVVDIRV